MRDAREETSVTRGVKNAETALRQAIRLLEGWDGRRPREYWVNVGVSCTALGVLLLSHSSDPVVLEEALAWLDKGLPPLRSLISESVAGAIERDLYTANLESRLPLLLKLGRHTEALMAVEDAGKNRVPFAAAGIARFARAVTLKAAEVEQAKLPWSRPPRADHAKAVALAEFLAAQAEVSDAAVYNAACAFALASVDGRASVAERERRASRAVLFLDRIASAGYFLGSLQIGELASDTDLDPLRGRADFQKLLERVGRR